MNIRPLFVVLPVSLVAAAGFALFSGANAAPEGRPELAQAQPAPPPPGAGPGMQPERPAFSPRNMCSEQVARRIGNRAYLKARLDLKPEQMANWTAFEKAADDASAKQKTRCSTLPAELKGPVSLTDRMGMQEEAMKARLEAIQSIKPALTTLYASLTPEQKAVLDRGGDRGKGGHGRSGHRHHR